MTAKTKSILIYIVTAVAVTVSLGVASFMTVGEGERFKALMLFSAFAALLFGAVAVRLKLPREFIFYAILLAGIAMRIGYVIYTGTIDRQHDVWYEYGHYPYITNLYEHWKLPDSYEGQFYHGPLSHIMIVLFLKLVGLTGMDPFSGSWIQVVPCILSCYIIVITYKIAQELRLSERVCLTVAALTAFHPTFYLLASSINNDTAMTFFFFLGVLYTIRYFNRPTMKHILILAVSIGCAMMSKLSGGMIALFTGPFFLAIFFLCVQQTRRPDIPLPREWQQFSGLSVKQLIIQFSAFLLVCAPLGLWHSIRGFLVLRQPLGFVPAPSIDSDLYLGWYTVKERFLSFPLSQYLGDWCHPRDDYNLWAYLLKCALFGEYEFDTPWLPVQAFLLIFLILTIVSIVCMCLYIRKKDVHPILRCGLLLLTLVQLALFVHFNIGYPFGCTMDFRYIVPTVIPFTIFTALAAEQTRNGTSRWKVAVSAILDVLIGAFCAFSVLIYVILY